MSLVKRALATVASGALAAGLLTSPIAQAPVSAAEVAAPPQVTGVITDRESGTPIPGACVSFHLPAVFTERRAVSCTDADGRYSVSGLPNGGYRLRVAAPGYAEQWWPDDPTFANASTVAIGTTMPATQTADLALRTRFGSVNGRILEATAGQRRAANVTVQLVAVDGSWSASYLSLYDGTFSAPNVPVGDYHIQLSSSWVSQWVPQASSEATAAVFTVNAGQATAVEETLKPNYAGPSPGTLSGTVTDLASGAPIAGATVSIVLSNGDVAGAAATANDGTYRLDAIPAMLAARMKITAPGYTEQWYNDRPTFPTAFFTGGGTYVRNVALRQAAGRLQGRITDPDGNGMAGTVQLLETNGIIYARTFSLVDGTFDLVNLKPGSFRLNISATGWGTQWYPGVPSAADATTITIGTDGITHIDQQFAARGGARISITDAETGAPVTDVCVRPVSAALSTIPVCNATDGTYLLTGLAPGLGRLVIDTGSALYFPAPTQEVTVASGATAEGALRLTRSGALVVPIAHLADGSVPALCLTAIPIATTTSLPGGAYFRDCDAAAGGLLTESVRLNRLPRGEYNVFVEPQAPYGAQWLGAQGGTGDQRLAAKISVTPGTTTTAPIIKVDRAGRIDGTITTQGYADGAGVAVTPASVRMGVPFSPRPAISTSGGYYFIDWLGPYSWPLLFDRPGVGMAWSGNANDRYAAKLIPVASDATSTYNITVPMGSSINRRDTNPDSITVVSAVTGDLVRSGSQAASGLPKGLLLLRYGGGSAGCWYYAPNRFGRARVGTPYLTGGITVDIKPGVNCFATQPPLLPVKTIRRTLISVGGLAHAAASAVAPPASSRTPVIVDAAYWRRLDAGFARGDGKR